MEKVTDFRRLLLESLSRKIIDQIVISVSRRPQEFIPLIQLTKDSEIKIAWRATWACEKLCKMYPEWFVPYYEQLIQELPDSPHDGIKRLRLSILYQLPVTGDLYLVGGFDPEFMDEDMNKLVEASSDVKEKKAS